MGFFRTADDRLMLWRTVMVGIVLGLVVSLASIAVFDMLLSGPGEASDAQLSELRELYGSEMPALEGGDTITGMVTVPSFECSPTNYCMGIVNALDGEQYIAVYMKQYGMFAVDDSIIGYGQREDFKIRFLDITTELIDLGE